MVARSEIQATDSTRWGWSAKSSAARAAPTLVSTAVWSATINSRRATR